MFGLEKLFAPKTDYMQLVQNGALVLDVRSSAEYAQGHIQGSKNIAVDHVRHVLDELKKMNKPIITCCRSGARSAAAAGLLKAAGIEVYNGGSWASLQKQLV